MSQKVCNVNTIAGLANVSKTMKAVKLAQNVEINERLLVLHGHAGYGKTTACSYVANQLRGHHIECCSHWSRKALLEAILYEVGLPLLGSVNDMFNAVIEELDNSGRPLIIDEVDHLVRNSTIELIRDIHDKAEIVVLLSGEEGLPKKLEKWPRVHSRVQAFIDAVPADLNDIKLLAELYCPGVEISDEWLRELHKQTGGNTRRVCVNLNRARGQAEHIGAINMETWGKLGWYTGTSPAMRRAV